jgi:hypothetical protein
MLLASDPLESDQAENIERCPVDDAALRANASSFGRRHDPLFPQREGEVGFAGSREDLADALQDGESVGV